MPSPTVNATMNPGREEAAMKNLQPPVRIGRTTIVVITAVAACLAGLSGPSTAHAGPCQQWRFDGYTQLNNPNGNTLEFDTRESSVRGQQARFVFNNGTVVDGSMDGGIYRDRVHVSFDTKLYSIGDYNKIVGNYDGAVAADGFAYGTTFFWEIPTIGTTNDRPVPNPRYSDGTGPWKSATPLRCADAAADDDVLTPAGVNENSGAFG